MTTFPENLTGLDKAAILFQVLGESLALTLFRDISESDILRIRVRSRELRHISISLKKSILEEYYFKMMSEKYRNSNTKDSSKLFGFLDGLTDEQIHYLLASESTRVVALATDQLSDEKKSTFLANLDTEETNDIIFEYGNLADIPLEAVVSIANELKKKVTFLPEPKEFSRGGGKSIANILGNMPSDEAEQYLVKISQEDPELYAEVKKYFITFDDLLDMPDHIMSEFWMNPDIDVDALAKALKGADEEEVQSIVEYLPKRKQAMFTPVDKPLSKKEVERAQLTIVELARAMEKEGSLDIEDIFGGELVE